MQDKHDICRTRVENDGMTMLGGAAMGMCVCVYDIAVLGEKAKRMEKKYVDSTRTSPVVTHPSTTRA